jgi:hypothetical protein
MGVVIIHRFKFGGAGRKFEIEAQNSKPTGDSHKILNSEIYEPRLLEHVFPWF